MLARWLTRLRVYIVAYSSNYLAPGNYIVFNIDRNWISLKNSTFSSNTYQQSIWFSFNYEEISIEMLLLMAHNERWYCNLWLNFHRRNIVDAAIRRISNVCQDKQNHWLNSNDSKLLRTSDQSYSKIYWDIGCRYTNWSFHLKFNSQYFR